MTGCRWPKGCNLPRSLDLEHGKTELCWYHAQIVRGEIEPTPAVFQRGGPLDDERLALGDALRQLGASDQVVRKLLTMAVSGRRRGA